MLYRLKRTIIWLRRFRYRRGYGVHSPFAFDFITNVIYERNLYYAYSNIEQRSRTMRNLRIRRRHSRKLARLLFRIVNRVQPQTILYATPDVLIPHYLHAAKMGAECVELTRLMGKLPGQIDFLLIDVPDTAEMKRTFYYALEKVNDRSVCVLLGIYRSEEMKKAWLQIINDAQTGITFDLYDAGIVFFDRSKNKQHYVVNF